MINANKPTKTRVNVQTLKVTHNREKMKVYYSQWTWKCTQLKCTSYRNFFQSCFSMTQNELLSAVQGLLTESLIHTYYH